jgi:odorant receptor
LITGITKEFGRIIWIQGLMCTVVLCMTAYSLVHVSFDDQINSIDKKYSSLITQETDQVVYSNHLQNMVSTTFQIFIPCYYGNELTWASIQLKNSLFYSNWIEQSRAFRSSMTIFMEVVKKPLKIDILTLFELSLENFLKIVNSAYSLHAIVKNFEV